MARICCLNHDNKQLQQNKQKPITFDDPKIWTEIIGSKKEISSESALQKLIEKYPQIIPWDDLPEPPLNNKVTVICNCAGPAATDIIFLEQLGKKRTRFCIGETKLAKNPEIYRTIVGQITEYASRHWGTALLRHEKKNEIEEAANAYYRDKGNDFYKHMKDEFGDDWKTNVWEPAFNALQKKDIRLLVISDKIPVQLKQIILFLGNTILCSAVEIFPYYQEKDNHILFIAQAHSAGNIPTPKEKLGLDELKMKLTWAVDELNELQEICKQYNGTITSTPQAKGLNFRIGDKEGVIAQEKDKKLNLSFLQYAEDRYLLEDMKKIEDFRVRLRKVGGKGTKKEIRFTIEENTEKGKVKAYLNELRNIYKEISEGFKNKEYL